MDDWIGTAYGWWRDKGGLGFLLIIAFAGVVKCALLTVVLANEDGHEISLTIVFLFTIHFLLYLKRSQSPMSCNPFDILLILRRENDGLRD